jgi:hypothetical protein
LGHNVFPGVAEANIESPEAQALVVGVAGLWQQHVADHHPRALRHEALRDGSSDAAHPTADQRDLVFKSRAAVCADRHRQLDPAGVIITAVSSAA